MTQATNHVTSNQAQMCPVTGLALITRPEWTDIDLGEGYTVTFQFIGPRILHSFSEGNAGLHGMENLIRERLKIIESMLGPDEPFFELRDYSKIRGLPTKAARDQLSKGMKITEKRMLGFIGYQATLPIKISLNVGKALHKAMFPARIVDTYETAVTMAVAVLGQAGYPCTTDKSALRVETRDDWFLDLKGFTNKLEVINGNIIHMVPNGFLEEAHVDPLFTMRESVIQSMNPPSRVKYFITNAAGVKGSSTRGRWYFVKRLSEWQHDHPLKMYVFYGASKWLRAAISIYKHLARFKIYAVKDFEAAMACVTNEELKNIDTAVPGHGENAQKAIPENELHQHIDDMLRFVGTINWEIDGFDAQNLLVDPQHPFSPLYDAVHLIKMDIDTLFQERKQEEEALRRAKEAAEAANRAKSQFLANMSHEIRTPMNGVLGMMDILQEASSTPMQREHVQTARECADSLLMVINNILDFSKIEAGELELECQPFNLKTIVEKACNSLRVEAEKKDLDSPVPGQATSPKYYTVTVTAFARFLITSAAMPSSSPQKAGWLWMPFLSLGMMAWSPSVLISPTQASG